MSLVWKGKQGIVLISEEPAFDAESGLTQYDTTWAGSKAAIFGQANALAAANISYRVSNNGPIYAITARVPYNLPTEVAELDRYEISTESQDKSIFEHPLVLAEMEAYDDLILEGQDSYRKVAEDFVKTKSSVVNDTTYPLFDNVYRHLKAGVTGFQVDHLVLRRFRKIDLPFAYSAGKVTLTDASVIYTTAQLNLPAGVAFVLPANPVNPSTDYKWGWKRRGQRVEIIGNYAEQTVELVFAPWSILLYSNATGALAW